MDVVSPDGDSAKGDRLILSTSDDKFYLTGDVILRVVNGAQSFTMDSDDDDAYVRFDSDGEGLETSKDGWKLTAVADRDAR